MGEKKKENIGRIRRKGDDGREGEIIGESKCYISKDVPARCLHAREFSL